MLHFLNKSPKGTEEKKKNANNNNNKFIPLAGVANAAAAAAAVRLRFLSCTVGGKRKYIIHAKQPHLNKTSSPDVCVILRNMMQLYCTYIHLCFIKLTG